MPAGAAYRRAASIDERRAKLFFTVAFERLGCGVWQTRRSQSRGSLPLRTQSGQSVVAGSVLILLRSAVMALPFTDAQ